jgi:RimJ/RimL family protein N-acetyltransferase
MTKDVTLRRADASHAGIFHQIRAEPGASRFQPLRPYSLNRLRDMLDARASLPLDHTLSGKVQWLIESGGEPAGWISLDVTSREHGTASVGYTVMQAYQGQGLATAAAQLVVALAFDPATLDLDRLEAVAAVENIGSRRVLTKSGFREEGIAQGLLVIDGVRVDHVRFGLLRTEWMNNQPS